MDRDELLNEPDYQNNINNRICICPHIYAQIEGIRTPILVDTGSEITCLSEEFFNANMQILGKCAKMPITGKNVRVAIGNKSTKITSQILCNLKIGNSGDFVILIIVPALAKNCILGYDAQKDLNIKILPESDCMLYNNEKIHFHIH